MRDLQLLVCSQRTPSNSHSSAKSLHVLYHQRPSPCTVHITPPSPYTPHTIYSIPSHPTNCPLLEPSFQLSPLFQPYSLPTALRTPSTSRARSTHTLGLAPSKFTISSIHHTSVRPPASPCFFLKKKSPLNCTVRRCVQSTRTIQVSQRPPPSYQLSLTPFQLP